jgi:hypothetical protein
MVPDRPPPTKRVHTSLEGSSFSLYEAHGLSVCYGALHKGMDEGRTCRSPPPAPSALLAARMVFPFAPCQPAPPRVNRYSFTKQLIGMPKTMCIRSTINSRWHLSGDSDL